jgi:hypothetical protein
MQTRYPQIALITQSVEEREASGRLQGIIRRRFSGIYNLCNLRNLWRVGSGEQI